ncbi:hypothetical protein [Epilithonimonas zeae]|uniref:hypothetical protein n=1 Tax=Epilithonimonas zeae TaxID=1416779 RepID=UPI002010C6C5|nr:hypothetical protein [Epilithonimonas zeae]UQB68980.1 hypothetical protein KI430_00610 [Epilithonimonas zeae]
MNEIIKSYEFFNIKENLHKEIKESILPLYGEFEYSKPNSDRYGRIKIKLDIERDLDSLNEIEKKLIEDYESLEQFYSLKEKYSNDFFVEKIDFDSYKSLNISRYHTYKWDVNENILPKEFETYIKPELINFIELFSLFQKENNKIYCFSVIDGAYKNSERPGHLMATKLAIINLFQKI